MRTWTGWGAITARVAVVAIAAAALACGSRAEEADGTADGRVAPAPADVVVANALREAELDDKAVLIEFGASWCKWCTNFRQFIESDDAGRVMRDNYVVVTLTVREEPAENKVLENPGGEEMMNHWGGATAGLPFYVFLDSVGNKIGDSNAMPDGTNIGYPVSEAEIERFMDLIDRTAPRVGEAERETLLRYLQTSAPPAS